MAFEQVKVLKLTVFGIVLFENYRANFQVIFLIDKPDFGIFLQLSGFDLLLAKTVIGFLESIH